MKPCFFDGHGRLEKNVANNPDFEVVPQNECPIQRAEEEIEISEVVKPSGEIIKKEDKFVKRGGVHNSWKTDAHRQVHRQCAKSAIETVFKDLWFPRHSHREASRV